MKKNIAIGLCGVSCLLLLVSLVAAQETPAAPASTAAVPQAQNAGASAPAAAGSAASSTDQPKPAPMPAPAPAPAAPALSFDQVIDLMVDREARFVERMQNVHPLVETYIQNMKPDQDVGMVPVGDEYFLGRLDFAEGRAKDVTFNSQPGLWSRTMDRLTSIYSMKFLPLGFAQMVMLDTNFDRREYEFRFVRREFLGEVRCLVIDVQPKETAGQGRFIGRIWVEDQDYNIIRFNGTYGPAQRFSYYLHFDSWRLNLRPGVWLPAYVYSEESELRYRFGQKLRFKAQTRLWGYDIQHLGSEQSFSQILVEAPQQEVKDRSEARQDASPLESQRNWEQQAEQNAVERLQKIGLLAPPGEVDRVLTTVLNNLEVTNNLDVGGDVKARVLLTTPLESFTIGHTVVVSRGLVDVLPDEASLATVLAHELSHIVLGHKLDTKLAFNDRLIFPDEKTFERMDFTRDARDEEAADKKAVELLNNSPYKGKLATPGLFLKMIQLRAPSLTHLIRSHLGNSLKEGGGFRMSALTTSAPELDVKKKEQIAALPLGGRVKVDPWTNQAELIKAKPLAIISASEKMPFEVTPFFPYVTRFNSTPTAEKSAALTTPAN